jgi:diguanylate cyclase (GGDEF)-like protein
MRGFTRLLVRLAPLLGAVAAPCALAQDPVPLSARLLDVDATAALVPDLAVTPATPMPRALPYRAHGSWVAVVPSVVPAQPRLVVESMVADTVTLVLPDGQRLTRAKVRRDADPHASGIALVFALPDDLPARRPLLLHFAHRHRALTDVRLYAGEAWRAHEQSVLLLMTSMYTALLAFAATSTGFWLVVRERVYGEYAAFLVASTVFMGAVAGLLYRVPGLEWLGALGIHGQWAIVLLVLGFAVGFGRDFLDVARHLPRLLPWFDGTRRALLVGALVVALWPTPIAWFGMTCVALAMVVFSTLLGVGALVALRGERYGWYFLAGWIPMAAAGGLRALHMTGLVAMGFGTVHLYTLGALVQSVVLMLGLADRVMRARWERDQARRAADRDALSGLLNRRALDARLRLHVAQSHAGAGRGLAMLFLDIDHFKPINDTYGHASGDAVIVAVARRIETELRTGDDLGRWGGEEFVALLPGAGVEDARRTSERVRAAIARAPIPTDAGDVAVTISIGIAVLDPSRDGVDSFVARADAALYRAKAGGRNRVEATIAAA